MKKALIQTLPFLAVGLLAACAQQAPQLQTKAPAQQIQVAETKPVATIASLTANFTADESALEAFRRACPRLLKRADQSGLTQPQDWQAACSDTQTNPEAFFTTHFQAVRLNDGKGLATGYFEPEIQGLFKQAPGAVPVLARPKELVDIPLKNWNIQGGTIRGLVKGNQVVRAPDRAAIDKGALSKQNLELAWAADPVDYFFLQIQGSGRLRMPDGSVMRIGYDGQNGHNYVAIGKLLRERGILQKAGMAEIKAWLRANPTEGVAMMHENPSYIFMRKLPNSIDGPIGALGVPLLPLANVATDPSIIPLGAPVWIETTVEGQPLQRLMIASDTGGAIKGPNRFDIFFGGGAEADRKAGALAAPLSALILLPKAAAQRLGQ